MRGWLWASVVVLASCQPTIVEAQDEAADDLTTKGSQFLFIWSGDKDKVESDFMSVVDLRDGSATYGDVVATLPIGATGTMPHHVEYEFLKAECCLRMGSPGT